VSYNGESVIAFLVQLFYLCCRRLDGQQAAGEAEQQREPGGGALARRPAQLWNGQPPCHGITLEPTPAHCQGLNCRRRLPVCAAPNVTVLHAALTRILRRVVCTSMPESVAVALCMNVCRSVPSISAILSAGADVVVSECSAAAGYQPQGTAQRSLGEASGFVGGLAA